LGDVFGEVKDMTGVEDMMTGVETTKNAVRNEGGS